MQEGPRITTVQSTDNGVLACADASSAGDSGLLERALSQPLTEAEILAFRTIRDGVCEATRRNYGDSLTPGPGLLGAVPTVRRFIGLSRRMNRRQRVAFIGIGCGYVPLWLASEGLNVDVYEADRTRAEWLDCLRDHFFGGASPGVGWVETSGGSLSVQGIASMNVLPESAGPADVVWIGRGLTTPGGDLDISQFLRWARRRIIASPSGVIAIVPPPGSLEPERGEFLYSAASRAHLKRLALRPLCLFRPFENQDDAAPREFVATQSEPPDADSSSTWSPRSP